MKRTKSSTFVSSICLILSLSLGSGVEEDLRLDEPNRSRADSKACIIGYRLHRRLSQVPLLDKELNRQLHELASFRVFDKAGPPEQLVFNKPEDSYA
jgi:hypothetical protein